MLVNQYNNGTLNLESKDLMDESEVKYRYLKDKINFNVNYKLEDPILALKA